MTGASVAMCWPPASLNEGRPAEFSCNGVHARAFQREDAGRRGANRRLAIYPLGLRPTGQRIVCAKV